MPKFRAYICYTVSEYVGEIEAKDEDTAKTRAAQKMEGSLCHHCSEHLDELVVDEIMLEKIDEEN